MNPFEETWATLGIAPTGDKQELRRAYTRKLKVTNPEDDPEGFKKLREAYEFALQFGSYQFEIDSDDRPASEPAQASEPAETPTEIPLEPTRPADPEGMALESAMAALAHELRSEGELDLEKSQDLLEKILRPATLERLDLLQRADESLAELLASSIPRSDPLLAVANERLEWGARQHEQSLSHFARQVVGRLGHLAFSEQLKSGSGEEAAAWARLAEPPNPALRWVRAFVLHNSSWPELTLIHKLEEEHPELLGELNLDNVRWWLRFEGRPRISAWAVGLWLVISACVGLVAYSVGDAPPSAQRAFAAFSYTALAFLLLASFRIYAIEWPIILTRRAWGRAPPRGFAYGWISAAVVLPLFAMTAGGAWFSWLCVAAALATVWWAAIAAGPVEPMTQQAINAFAIRRSRLLRMLVFNVFAFIWLFLIVDQIGEQLGGPLIVTMIASLCASGLGRDLQIRGFADEIPAETQKLFCQLAIGAALLLGFFVLQNGGDAEWQPALVVAVLGFTILRRAAPVDLKVPDWVYRWGWFFVIVGANALRTVGKATSGLDRYSDESYVASLITDGALIFLGGVLIAAGSFLRGIRKRSAEAADQA